MSETNREGGGVTCSTCHDSGKVKAREFPTVYIDCRCKPSNHTNMKTPRYQIINGIDLSVLQFKQVLARLTEKFEPVQNDYIYDHAWYFNGDAFMGVWR